MLQFCHLNSMKSKGSGNLAFKAPQPLNISFRDLFKLLQTPMAKKKHKKNPKTVPLLKSLKYGASINKYRAVFN